MQPRYNIDVYAYKPKVIMIKYNIYKTINRKYKTNRSIYKLDENDIRTIVSKKNYQSLKMVHGIVKDFFFHITIFFVYFNKHVKTIRIYITCMEALLLRYNNLYNVIG